MISSLVLYWFGNTKEPMPENQYLSQHNVGLLSKINWFIKRGKDMTSPIGTHPSTVQQFWLFTANSAYFQQIVHERDLNDLHSYKNIFGQRGLVYEQKFINNSFWKLHEMY